MDDGFLKVWSELIAAYYGKASHGDTAEIYAYHLTPYLPTMMHESTKDKAFVEAGLIAHHRMLEICTKFKRLMDCRLIFLDSESVPSGISLNSWARLGRPFIHRIHVKVEHDD